MSEPDRLSEEPPLLGSWNRLYAVVLGNLVFLIALFYGITRFYAP